MNNERMIVTAYGGPEVLRLIDEPLRRPAHDEVLIRVEAAGVAMGDVMRRKGVYPAELQPPFTPGYDIVGRIVEAGGGVRRLRAGDRAAVLFDGIGGYARYVCVREQEAAPVPEQVDAHEAVSAVLNYVTAYQLLTRAVNVEEARRVLIHGAAGGVGTALLEIGRLLGLELIGTASAPKLPAVRSYGAWGIDYRQQDFVEAVRARYPDGLDAVFDPIGGDHWRRSAQTLRTGGRLIGFGFTAALQESADNAAGTQVREDWSRLARGQWSAESVHASMYSITQWKKENPDWFMDDLAEVFRLLAAGRIKPRIFATLPLQEAANAHRLLEQSQSVGKVTLNCT